MVEVRRTVTEVALTTDGFHLNVGDSVLIKVDKQYIVTKFTGLEKGYFATENSDGEKLKYRMGSIISCYKIKDFTLVGDEEEEK